MKKSILPVLLVAFSITALGHTFQSNFTKIDSSVKSVQPLDEVEIRIIYITQAEYEAMTKKSPVNKEFYLITNSQKYFVGRTYDDLIAFASGAYDSGLDSEVIRNTMYYVSEIEHGEATFVFNKSSTISHFK